LKRRSIECLIIVCIVSAAQDQRININSSGREKTSPLCFFLYHQQPPMLRLDDMHRSGGYSSTKAATIPAATFQTPIRFGTPDTPPHNASPYPIINQQLSNPPSPGPARAYPNRSATLSYPAPQPIDPVFPHIEDGMQLITSPRRPPSFDPGVYEIKNDVLGLSVDFNEVDRKSVVGFQYHGKANQRVSLNS